MTTAPTLSGIYIYPVKSCRGISLASTSLDTWGLKYDRNWMVVNAEGRFLTQRQFPRLALVETALTSEHLQLSAPKQSELHLPLSVGLGEEVDVVVWQDKCRALDWGDEAASWLSAFLGVTCRLVGINERFHRPVDPAYAPASAQVNFADGFPSLLISEASLSDLSIRCSQSLPMNRFRPNFVVSGCEPYSEDRWRTVRIGGITFDVVKPCQRCIITTIDQMTGLGGSEPLKTLATYRRVRGGVTFGQNLVHRELGEVHLGDSIEVLSAIG
jgi:uncharacterized protein YcbX